MADQVNFFCLLMFLVCLACNMVPDNWHICVNKGITYLLTYILCPNYQLEIYPNQTVL